MRDRRLHRERFQARRVDVLRPLDLLPRLVQLPRVERQLRENQPRLDRRLVDRQHLLHRLGGAIGRFVLERLRDAEIRVHPLRVGLERRAERLDGILRVVFFEEQFAPAGLDDRHRLGFLRRQVRGALIQRARLTRLAQRAPRPRHAHEIQRAALRRERPRHQRERRLRVHGASQLLLQQRQFQRRLFTWIRRRRRRQQLQRVVVSPARRERAAAQRIERRRRADRARARRDLLDAIVPAFAKRTRGIDSRRSGRRFFLLLFLRFSGRLRLGSRGRSGGRLRRCVGAGGVGAGGVCALARPPIQRTLRRER